MAKDTIKGRGTMPYTWATAVTDEKLVISTVTEREPTHDGVRGRVLNQPKRKRTGMQESTGAEGS